MDMIKRIIAFTICAVLMLGLTACGAQNGSGGSPQQGVNEVLESGMKEADAKKTTAVSEPTETKAASSAPAETTAASVETTAAAPETTAAAAKEPDPTVDYDLTVMTGNLAYAQVANLLQNADESRGKTVKVIGLFNAYYIQTSDYMYIACVIPDPTGCCLQGIEFDLGEDAVYPDDYPSYGTIITVRGTYDTYQRDGSTFGILRNATAEWAGKEQ